MSQLKVLLSGVECGVITQSKSGNLTFRYTENYSPVQTPLSLSMPFSSNEYRKSQILPFLQGLLPDNPAALRSIALAYGISVENPFAMLGQIGGDVAGALQFINPDRSLTSSKPSISLNHLDIESLLQQKISEYSSGIPVSVGGFFSLAGAQPKLALHKQGDTWMTGSDNKPTTHILKPLTNELPDLDLAEILTMETARQIGLNVANAEFAQFGRTRCLVVERYDRKTSREKTNRIHQEDLLQALGVHPQKKYQKLEGGPGLRRIGNLFKTLPNPQRQSVSSDFFDAFVFNVLIRATDAHAKNYSLLLEGNSVKLAPLYDLITGAYFPNPKESAISVEGEYRFDFITSQMLASEGERFGVPASLERVQRMRDALPSAVESSLKVILDQTPKTLHASVKKLARALLNLF